LFELGLPNGLGLGWRAETSAICAARRDLVFFEVVAESVPLGAIPLAIEILLASGRPVIPHGVSLGLGSGERVSDTKLRRLTDVAKKLRAPCVSEHLAWVRGGGHETEHLLPVPRTRAALAITCDNVKRAVDAVGVPLVLENIAALHTWPEDALIETDMLSELVHHTGRGCSSMSPTSWRTSSTALSSPGFEAPKSSRSESWRRRVAGSKGFPRTASPTSTSLAGSGARASFMTRMGTRSRASCTGCSKPF
jgi:hypothetical protein